MIRGVLSTVEALLATVRDTHMQRNLLLLKTVVSHLKLNWLYIQKSKFPDTGRGGGGSPGRMLKFRISISALLAFLADILWAPCASIEPKGRLRRRLAHIRLHSYHVPVKAWLILTSLKKCHTTVSFTSVVR